MEEGMTKQKRTVTPVSNRAMPSIQTAFYSDLSRAQRGT